MYAESALDGFFVKCTFELTAGTLIHHFSVCFVIVNQSVFPCVLPALKALRTDLPMLYD